MRYTTSELDTVLRSGLLAFPVTCFDATGDLAKDACRACVESSVVSGAVALFAPGGTGEFFSLDAGDYRAVVRAAVAQAAGRMPILAGAGHGVRQAIAFAECAAAEGADGLLLFPPYLMRAEQAGLFAYVSAVCAATPLGVVVYNRDNAVYSPETIAALADRHANLIGFKDGHGDVEQLVLLRSAVGDRLGLIGGMPTAEVYANAYKGLGFATYSSAIYNFLPELAVRFFEAVRRGDTAFTDRVIGTFFRPYLALRNRRRGYAVSIVKAGMQVTGRNPGPVRPPLGDLTEAELADLRAIIDGVPALLDP